MMRASTDPHNTLWTTDDRNPVTLAQIGRAPPGLRYGVRPVDLNVDDRGAHMAEQVKQRQWRCRGAVARQWLPDEDANLYRWRGEGVAWADISARLGRTCIACEKRFGVLYRRALASGGEQ